MWWVSANVNYFLDSFKIKYIIHSFTNYQITIGKVLYCKRTDEIESREKSLCQNKTRYKLEIDPEELLENIPTSANSFTAFLHQSYTDFFTNMKDLAGAAENLSLCDPFFHEWTVS